VGHADFIIRDEQLVHLVERRGRPSEKWGRVHLWQLRALAKGRRSFWAVALLACIQREALVAKSKCRDNTGWVKVSRRLLSGIDPPSGKAKRAALDEMEAAGILEVRRRGHHAPVVRLLREARAGEAA